jgi:hypothetical protein
MVVVLAVVASALQGSKRRLSRLPQKKKRRYAIIGAANEASDALRTSTRVNHGRLFCVSRNQTQIKQINAEKKRHDDAG